MSNTKTGQSPEQRGASHVATGDLLSLLRFAREKIHVRPPGLEDHKTTKWAVAVSRVLPEFDHWDGQPKANRKHVEASWNNKANEPTTG